MARTVVRSASAKGMITVVLADCNARVGADGGCRFIGSCEAECDNKNGLRFSAFLSEHELFAANTFWKAGYTWRSSWKSVHRLDYIMLPQRLFDGVVQCSVFDDVELARGVKEDHRLLFAELSFKGDCSEKSSK